MERIDTHLDASPWWGHRFDQGYLSFNLLVDLGSAEIQVIDHEELKGVRWVPLSDLIEEWTRKLPSELSDPAIRSATEAVNQRAAELRARAGVLTRSVVDMREASEVEWSCPGSTSSSREASHVPR